MYDLYNAPIKEYTVGEDEGDPMANAQTLKDWFMQRHPQVQILLANHIGIEVWDQIARNKKKGYDRLLEAAPGSFTRENIKHARSKALPQSMANVAHAKWTGNMLWEKGQYQDGNSCLFTDGYSKHLHNMVNSGITMLAFFDEKQEGGIGRLFVGTTHGGSQQGERPTGLYCFEGVGHLGEMGYMPHQSGADIIQQLTNLPHKVVLGNDITWVGKTRPTDDERDILGYVKNSYNQFVDMKGVAKGVPPAFECNECKTNLREWSSRIHVPGKDKATADELKELANQVDEARNHYYAVSNAVERTATGRLAAVYNKRTQEAAAAYYVINEKWKGSRSNLVPVCMECHYHAILSA